MREFMRKDPPAIPENQNLVDASVALLREDVDLLPVTSRDGSGRVVGVMSPLDVILKAIEPISDERKLA
jgi:CBS domain-containing protein